MIHREGYKILLITLLILVVINLLSNKFVGLQWIRTSIIIASSVVFVLFLQFFRNPTRNTVINPNHIIAPADGKVVVIEEVVESEYFKDKRIQVSIFMSPLNVHVNRNPTSGAVSYFKYHPGDYLVAWHPKSSTLNERTTAVIRDSEGKEILFRQIAGAVARRIRYYISEGDSVQQGEEMGFIKFGSRIDVFLPIGTNLDVKIGDLTKGGESVIASYD
jgi:phosphatidylserine decarboxylase